MKWDSSLECVCLRVWEEGVEDVYLQLSPFWRAGANQCSLSLFKSQWESFLALVLLLFHLTFKLYLLGKPGISESKQFGRVWVKVKAPSLSCDIYCTGALAGFRAQRFAALRCLLRPQDAAASQGRPHWRFAWAVFVKSSLAFLCSPQSGELGCDIADFFPFHLKVIEVLKQRHFSTFHAPHRTSTTRTVSPWQPSPLCSKYNPTNPNFSAAASSPALPELVYLGTHCGFSGFFFTFHRFRCDQ